MNAHTDIQIIKQPDGAPAFAIIPWADYLAHYHVEPAQTPKHKEWTPHEVVEILVSEQISPAAAWRKYLGLTQAEVAARIGISQSAYAQQETATKPRKATREKIALALGIDPKLLDI